MRYILIYLLLFLFSISKAYSDIKGQIISNLEKTNNYSFNFIQQINKKKETGNCILVFNRKINCKYDNSGKILVSDGKNLVIKSNNSNIPSFYKLKIKAKTNENLKVLWVKKMVYILKLINGTRRISK